MKIRDEYAAAKIPMLPVIIGMPKTCNIHTGKTALQVPYSLALYAFGLGLVHLVIAAVSGRTDACIPLQILP